MRYVRAFIILAGLLGAASISFADTVVLRNGDRLTGTIEGSDGKVLTLKTDYAGEIKLQWTAVTDVTSSTAVYVVTPEKKMVNGNVTVAGTDLVVHTAAAGEVRIPLSQATVIRSADAEQSYEKSLHPGWLGGWTGNATVGFALARGNSDTTNVSTGLNADRKTMEDELKAYASSIYTTNGATLNGGTGNVTADAVLGGVRYDRNISPSFFGFGSVDFAHDALQDLNLRSIFTGGVGWHVINHPNTTLDLLGGINYTRESYSGSMVSVGRNLSGITAGEDFMHKFGPNTVFTEHFDFYPDFTDSDYRLTLNSAVVTKINRWFGWQTTFSDLYVTNPPIAGTKSNDVIFSTGLNIAFSH